MTARANAHAYELLRRRDALKRTRQVWLAGLVVWGVVVGWLAFGFVNSVTDDMDVRLTWVLTWLVPVLVLGVGSLLTHRRLAACEAQLVQVDRPD